MTLNIIRIVNIAILIFFCNVFVMAQSKKNDGVPQVVKDSFAVKFPNTYVHDWEFKRKDKLYEAEFKINNEKQKAYFAANGQWQYSKKDIKIAMVPDAILQHIKTSTYGTWKIDDADVYQSPEHAKYFVVEVELNLKEVDLHYLPDGTLLKSVNKK